MTRTQRLKLEVVGLYVLAGTLMATLIVLVLDRVLP
jgi:hypothetical protein